MTNLMDKDHVKNHRWFKNLKADSAAKEKRIRKHAQSIDLGDSTGKPNLSDMFSSANRLGLLNNSKKLPDLIKTAILTAREVIDQFDFPISPAITYLGVKNVKTAGTTDDVLSGTIVLMCKFATVGGLKQSFDVPVQVVSGKVLPPSVIKFNGRDIVLAQSSVNAMVQRASSYELIPVRKQFSAPLTRDERESATELRNEIGYQAREGIGPVSTIRRTYKKAQEEEEQTFLSAEEVDNPEGYPLVEAVKNWDVEGVKEILASGFVPEDEWKAAWAIASEYGMDDVRDKLRHYRTDNLGDAKQMFREVDNHPDNPRNKGAESDLTDKITPNEPMADMDDAKKFQNEPLRAKKAKNTLGFEFTSEEDAQEFFDSLEGTEFEVINVHFMNVGDTINAYVDQKALSNPEELQKLYHRFYDELGRRDTSGEDSDIDLNHFAKKSVKTNYGPDDGDYNFSPEGRDLFNAVEIEDVELVKQLLESSGIGIPEREMYYAWLAADEGGLEEIKKVLTEFGQKLYHGKEARVASMGTHVPGGYEKVKELMDKAQDEGKDTFPRAWIHVLRNYILEVVSTASQDSWATHLVNDGYVLNPYGSNNRGREKTAQMDEDWVEESEKEESDRWKDVSKNIDAEFKYLAEQLGDRGLSGLQRQYDELYPEGILGGLDTPSFKEFVVEKYKNKSAQVEDEWNDELTMDEPDSHIYDGTKTPMEPGDSVKFQGHDGAIRGTVVEVNKAENSAIVKARGYEYRVALEDIQPLNSTFKKMWSASCLRILPPGKKYAQIFNNMEKNPSIDNPWAATWDARDKDIHSGPPETKNKDVKPILKGIGKKSVKRPFVE